MVVDILAKVPSAIGGKPPEKPIYPSARCDFTAVECRAKRLGMKGVTSCVTRAD